MKESTRFSQKKILTGIWLFLVCLVHYFILFGWESLVRADWYLVGYGASLFGFCLLLPLLATERFLERAERKKEIRSQNSGDSFCEDSSSETTFGRRSTDETASKPSKRFSAKRMKNALLTEAAVLFCSILYFAFVAFYLPVVWIGPETTYLVEPRTDDGKRIDYFQAISDRIEPKISPQENGFRSLAESLGINLLNFYEFDEETRISENFSNDKQRKATLYWREFCRRLELDPERQGELNYNPPDRFFQKRLEEDENFQRTVVQILSANERQTLPTENPSDFQNFEVESNEKKAISYLNLLTSDWTANVAAETELWFRQNEAALDLFCRSIRQKNCFVPMVRLSDQEPLNPLPNFGDVILRRFVSGLKLRTARSLDSGDVAAALGDLDAIYAAAALNRDFSLYYWESSRLLNEAITTTAALIDSGKLSSSEIENLLKKASSFDFDLNRERFLWLARLEALDFAEAFFSGRFFDSDLSKKDDATSVKIFLAFGRMGTISRGFKKINDDFDRYEEALKTNRKVEATRGAFFESESDCESLFLTLRKMLRKGVNEFAASFPVVFDDGSQILDGLEPLRERLAVRRDLLLIEGLLEIYRCENQEYPENLDALRSLSLVQNSESTFLPNDFYRPDQPYRYRRSVVADKITSTKNESDGERAEVVPTETDLVEENDSPEENVANDENDPTEGTQKESALSENERTPFDSETSYLLYSVGPNQIDDFEPLELVPINEFFFRVSNPSLKPEEKRRGDDVSLRPVQIWNI